MCRVDITSQSKCVELPSLLECNNSAASHLCIVSGVVRASAAFPRGRQNHPKLRQSGRLPSGCDSRRVKTCVCVCGVCVVVVVVV